MGIGLLGIKLGMTQIFEENGNIIPVTVVKVEPNQILEIRTAEKNGYNAIQLGIGEKKEKKITKPLAGQFLKLKEKTDKDIKAKKVIKEFRVDDVSKYHTGDFINIDLFENGEIVDITGISKGKGYQGVMKRHNFAGGPASHGSQFHRHPGAIGQHTWPARVHKGQKMAGRMGCDKITVKNLKIAGIDKENNLILIKGAIPGAKRGIVIVKKKK